MTKHSSGVVVDFAQVVGATWQLTGTTDFSPCSLDHKINAAVRRTVRLLQNGVYLEEAKLERRLLHNMLKLLALPRDE
jgi:hypothetical protein